MLAWRPLPWAAVLFVGATHSLTARAREPAPRVRLEFHAADECPNADDFTANVRTKAVFELENSPERASRTFVVELSERANGTTRGYRGELRVMMPRGATSTRAVSGVNCSEVAEAIAVIIAIELGPENRAEPEPLASTPERKPPVPPVAAATLARWRWAAAADFGLTSAVASTISPDVRLSLMLHRESSALLSPEFRAGFAYVDGRTTVNDGGSLKLRLFGVPLEACPTRVRLSRQFSVEPCAKALLALRVANGGPPSNPEAETSTGFWADIGGFLRASFAFSERWWLELSTEGFVVLVRDRFHTFSPNVAVFEPPFAGVRVALGLGFAFSVITEKYP